MVNFDKAVNVAGTPLLALNSGASASYTGGSGASTLIFSYTVGTGDASSTLDYSSAGALSLNGGAIVLSSLAGSVNYADLTLVTPGQPGSISSTKTLVIATADSTAPTATPLAASNS